MKARHWLQSGVLLGLSALLVLGMAEAGVRPNSTVTPMDYDTVHFDANNIDMFVSNEGSFAYDFSTGNSGLAFPKPSTKTVIYAAGLYVGARVNGQTRISVAEYSNSYSPGAILANGQADDPLDGRYQMYKIAAGDNASNNPDYANWPVEDGAPVDSAGNPLLIGDQTLWAVYNDLHEPRPPNNAASEEGLGVEIQQTTFGFNRTGALGNIVFLSFKIKNKGQNTLEDTYVSVWSDPDLGGAADDLVGCDTTLSLGYCYNATNSDDLYGSAPPAVGFDFFQGPIVPSEGDTALVSGQRIPGYRNLPMTSFNKYINGTDPDSPQSTYNYMRGLDADGSDLVNPVTGQRTSFMVSGDPVRATGWLDSDPSDRRMFLSSGPFTMAPGDSQIVVTAVIIGQGKDRLTSVTALKFFDFFAQTAFDLNFELPSPPPRPEVRTVALDEEVVLYWGDVSETTYDEPGYAFEGYNVYMGESAAGPWTRIATFDVNNNVGIVFDDQFDAETGVVINQPVQFGADTGMHYSLSITNDFVRGGTLRNAKPYYFAVTAYGYGPEEGAGLKTLENSIEAIEVVPQSPTAGTRLEGGANDTLNVVRISGNSDGSVAPIIVDPTALTGHRYRVTFVENPDEEAREEFPIVWNLIDVTTGQTLLENQTNQTPAVDTGVTDGFIANVVGPSLAVREAIWTSGTDDAWLGAVNAGLSGFNGGIGLGYEFQGSTLAPADYSKIVEILFTPDEDQWSDAPVFRRDLAYAFDGIGRFPGQAWDVTDPANKRRLNIGLVENATEEKPADRLWNPDGSDNGGREYFFVMNSDYNGGVDYNDDNPARSGDVLVAGWTRVRGTHTFLETADTLRITNNFINTEADVFEWQTVGVQNTPELTKSDLKQIRVVPNPYFAHSQYEQNQFQRVVKFTNLPAECTVRIFNIAGELIRTLEKPRSSSGILEWNLLTDRSLPIGSGVYVYHVEARDGGRSVGTTFGRLAVFIEKERLNTF